jgi:hypothetical protein
MFDDYAENFPLLFAHWLRYVGVKCSNDEVDDALRMLIKQGAFKGNLRRCVVGLAQDINPQIPPSSQELSELVLFVESVSVGFLQGSIPVMDACESTGK